MAWTWRYENRSGDVLSDQSAPSFDSRSDAESWLGEAWRDLAENGVDQVSLLDGDRVVVDGMSLHPPGSN